MLGKEQDLLIWIEAYWKTLDFKFQALFEFKDLLFPIFWVCSAMFKNIAVIFDWVNLQGQNNKTFASFLALNCLQINVQSHIPTCHEGKLITMTGGRSSSLHADKLQNSNYFMSSGTRIWMGMESEVLDWKEKNFF